jgi:hypothetical protein
MSPPDDPAIWDDSPYEEGIPLVPGRLAEGECWLGEFELAVVDIGVGGFAERLSVSRYT